jgi:hypothetical protein
MYSNRILNEHHQYLKTIYYKKTAKIDSAIDSWSGTVSNISTQLNGVNTKFFTSSNETFNDGVSTVNLWKPLIIRDK